MRTPPRLLLVGLVGLFGLGLVGLGGACSKPSGDPSSLRSAPPPSAPPPSAPPPSAPPPMPATVTRCVGGSAGASAASGGPACFKFATADEAFRWVLAHDPAILAVGEAHAQKGTEGIASATKRFTESMLPALEGRASDLLVEAWAGDPRCQKEVKAVASAQRPVKNVQADTNPNEYVVLGTRAKALGIQPHLLRPTCDDYAGLADAGDGAITASLELIKRLTQADATSWFRRNGETKNGKLVVTYGGAMHNDVAPSSKLRAFSFGPELVAETGGRYVELDLIVPEYVKPTDVWQNLPWYAAWQADTGPKDRATLFRLGERSFVLVFPAALKPAN